MASGDSAVGAGPETKRGDTVREEAPNALKTRPLCVNGTEVPVQPENYRAGQKVGPRLREFFRQLEAEVMSNSRHKLHQTLGPLFGPPLYTYMYCLSHMCPKTPTKT